MAVVFSSPFSPSHSSLKLSIFFFLSQHKAFQRGFPGGSEGKQSVCDAGDLCLIPGLGRSPGGRNGNTVQYFCLKNPNGQGNLAGYSPWGCKESDMTERLSLLKKN